MRYFIVSYIKTPRGKMDEVVAVSKNLKNNDVQTASVILDFKQGQVIKASLGQTTVPRDFVKIRDFYRQHYTKLVADLEAVYGRYEIEPPADSNPDTVSESSQ